MDQLLVTSVSGAALLDPVLKNPRRAHDLIDMPERAEAEEDRRRSPRFACGGRAEINCLPSCGILVPGTIRDLSLHGCWVDTLQPIDRGARTEIVVRVNAASFRAVGEVRAVRGASGAGLEFVHLSLGGKDMLESLVEELARLQAVMNKLKSARREMNAEAFKKELESGKHQAAMLSERFRLLKNVLPAENSEGNDDQSVAGDEGVEERLVVGVNLFG
ncbi:MAG: PilZ domain-containing protein [Terriglobales bacterium]